MSGKNFSPGDIVLDAWTINGFDVSTRLMEFNVFENIKNAYTILTATVLDCSDIINTNLGLNGSETISVAFKQPGMQPYTGTFALTQIEIINTLDNQRSQMWKLSAYSPHMMSLPLVTKSYKNITCSDAIADLCKSYLNLQKPFKMGDKATALIGNDMHPYVIGNIQIFQALKAIMQRSDAAKDQSASWVLYENNSAFNLDTMGNLLSSASPVASYIQRPLGSNFLLDQALQSLVIINMHEETRFNTSEQVQSAVQKTDTYDIQSKEFKTKIDRPVIQGLGGDAGSNLRGNPPATRNYIPIDPTAPATNAEKFIPYRKAMAAALDSQSVTCLVAFNSALTVGKGVEINTIAPGGDTNTPLPDKVAGTGLIVEINHWVNLRTEKMMGKTTFKSLMAGAND